MYAIRVSNYGGPEVMEYVELPTPQPGAGEALVKVKAAGVNYIDVYHRAGIYAGQLPLTPGMEASGVVEAVGEGVTEFKVGDRVAYCSQQGSYAEYHVVPAAKLVPVPEGLDDQAAAAALLQGMTAHFLSSTTYPIQPGDTVLVHAAAGGVGLILTQLAKMRGGRVIATVSTPEKADLAREAGADEIILYTQQDFEEETRRLTDGKGVAAVYDSVGKDTFLKGLNVLRTRGIMISYGQSSGAVEPIVPTLLSGKGSLYLTRPTLFTYTATRPELLHYAGDVLNWIKDGKLKLRIEHLYTLKEAVQAHRDLEARKTTGKLLLEVE